ncbi:ABC transporter substrate-binding protein [Nocardioides acrostichi]|uniref:ABC transporter substrate-binding protein n=1 Tax=Nocardioides acrostichi TaxID=2784339 RepID=A0A930UWI9_9ACTN|nr:ABC transporter substrate-binding protein [Nocardioides acrostichi]MBF4161456.1 ABC transporter substrate-binding protein [Nocardioides acrostichi]
MPIPPDIATGRRRFLAGLSLLALAPGLAACGSGADDSGPSGGADSENGTQDGTEDGTEDGAFPVTIEHKYGSTTIDRAPERVVCVGLTDQDTLMALGTVPVAITYWFGDESLHGIYPWAEDYLGEADPPTVLKDSDGIEIEKVAALAPDLIIGQYSGMSAADYKKLSALGVPVVAQNGDYADYGTPWDVAALTLGTAIGKPEAAQRLVDAAKESISQAAAAHPEFEGETAAVVTPYEGLFIYGPEDPRSQLLTQLGFTLHPLITGADDSEFGISLSSERTTDLGDAGAVVWIDYSGDKQIDRLWEGTTAYDEGRWFDINGDDSPDYYVAHSFVTPLSIPYLVERYVPQLSAAVDGDPQTAVPAVRD